MDPQAVLYALLDAMKRNDRTAVALHLESLAEWNRAGGFLPNVASCDGPDCLGFLVALRSVTSTSRTVPCPNQ